MERYQKIIPFAITSVLLLLLLTPHLFFTVADSENMLNIAVSIYELGDMSISVQADQEAGTITRVFSKYSLGLPLLMVPVLWLRDLLGAGKLILTFVNIVILALTAVSVSSIVTSLGYSFRRALFISVATIFGSFLFPYASLFLSEPLQALTITSALAFLLKAFTSDKREDTRLRSYLASAALMLGYGVLTKATVVIVIPLFIAYVFIKTKERGEKPLGALFSFILPLFLWAVAISLLNYARFGSPFEFGYGEETSLFTNPVFEGIRNLLINPNRGLLIFAPVMLLFPFALWRLAKKARPESWLIGSAFILNLLVYSAWWAWEGGGCWGPRFLLPFIPLAFVSFAPLLGAGLPRVIICILLGAGLLINLLFTAQDLTGYGYLVLKASEDIEVVSPRLKRDQMLIYGKLHTPPGVVSSYISEFSEPRGHLWLVSARLEGWRGGYGLGSENHTFLNPPWIEKYPPKKGGMGAVYRLAETENKARINCSPSLWLMAITCPDIYPSEAFYYDALTRQAKKAHLFGRPDEKIRLDKKALALKGDKERLKAQMRTNNF